MLPDSYVSALHLPFNRAALEGRFAFGSPDRDPGGAGALLLLQGSSVLVTAAGELPSGALANQLALREPLYLGQWDGQPCRVARLPSDELPAGLVAESLLAAAPQLSIELLSLGVLGRQVLLWQRLSRFCSKCGGGTDWFPGHWGVRCGACAFVRFPAVHPCVIVLIRRDDELLLVRKAEWAAGRYGLVAGFLDMGECLEEAVAREVLEETGLQVTNVEYLGSQAWPFPSQLMAGFRADYAGGQLCIEEEELEEGQWFPLDTLPSLPPKRSIARFLIDREVARG